jgi:site-specific recombinase XerD
MRTSISFFPNVKKQNKRSGKIPIYLRVVHNKLKAEARLNEELTPAEVLKWNPLMMRLDIRECAVNSRLNAISRIYDEFRIMQAGKLHQYQASSIRDILIGNVGSKELTILDYAQQYYSTAIHSNGRLTVGTKKNYCKALKHLASYLQKTNSDSLLLSALTSAVAINFWDYLLSTDPSKNKKGMSEVSASGMIKKFRTIFDRAVNEGMLAKNPFKLLRLKTRSEFRQKLTVNEVSLWFQADLTDFPALILYRDIFSFGCFTGLAYSDIMTLDRTHLIKSETGYFLQKNRQKTGEQTQIMLTSLAANIIDKYKSHPDSNNFRVFPIRSLNSINTYNKTIADKIGISNKVTSHIARHSFRQLLANAGVEDEGVIKKMMGQSRNSNIDSIYYQVTEARLVAARDKFELFLISNLQQ